MREPLLRTKFKSERSFGTVAVVLMVVISFFSTVAAFARTTDLATESTALSNQLQDMTQQFEDAHQRLGNLLTANSGQKINEQNSDGFFTMRNIGIWLLWVLLVGLLLLLTAMRRSILLTFSTASGENSDYRKKAGENQKITPQKQVLVQPVKVVKIKVRKIKNLKKQR